MSLMLNFGRAQRLKLDFNFFHIFRNARFYLTPISKVKRVHIKTKAAKYEHYLQTNVEFADLHKPAL